MIGRASITLARTPSVTSASSNPPRRRRSRPLRSRPLPAAEQDEHLEVDQLRRMRPVILGHDELEHEQERVVAHRLANAPEDSHGVVICPVVEDLGQQVDVAAGRRLVEEAPANRRAPLGEAVLLDLTLGRAGDAREVEDDPAQMVVDLEQHAQHRAVPSAHVDDGPHVAPVALEERREPRRRPALHRPVERLGVVGMLCEVVEERRPEELVERRAAGPGRLERPAPRPVGQVAEEDRVVASRARPLDEQLTDVGEAHDPGLRLCEDAHRHERPEDALERVGVGPHLAGHLRDLARPAHERVRHAKLRHHVQALRAGEAPHEGAEPLERRGSRLAGLPGRHRRDVYHRAQAAMSTIAIAIAMNAPKSATQRASWCV